MQSTQPDHSIYDTDVQKLILAEGGDIVPSTPEEFADLIHKALSLGLWDQAGGACGGVMPYRAIRAKHAKISSVIPAQTGIQNTVPFETTHGFPPARE